MAAISDILTYRNGGIEFTVSGTSIDGRFGILKLRSPIVPVVRNGAELPQSSPEIAEVQRLLEEWLQNQSPEAIVALAELDSLREWRNLPDYLNKAVLLHRVRGVIQHLESSRRKLIERQTATQS
jgi:hypothetical protein